MLKINNVYERTYLYEEDNHKQEFEVIKMEEGRFHFIWSTLTGQIDCYMYKNNDDVEFIFTESFGYIDEDDESDHYFQCEKNYKFNFDRGDNWSRAFEQERLTKEYEKLFKLREWLDYLEDT